MNIPNTRMFSSDNIAPVHPKVMKALQDINVNHCIAYGEDPYSESAIKKFKEIFGDNIDVYFVFNGTAANVLSIANITNTYNSVICSEVCHLNLDECGAPEKYTGCKLIPLPTPDGKIRVEQFHKYMFSFGFEHQSQPKVITITQTSVYGTVYAIDEIKKITGFAHKNNMLVHMDGARISNAAVALNCGFKEMTVDAGVDVLSFGMTKNGLMYGEAVVFFDKKMSENFKYIRKQGSQLASKMRYIAVQYETILSNNLWHENAKKANAMAKLLFEKIKDFKEIKVTQKVEANAVFAVLPAEVIEKIQKEAFFYIWDDTKSEIRWMTSFDTTEEDIENFVKVLRKYLK
ncbi:MAG: low specificity L-threonine aldolase [Bacteroidales bacterium]|nr:low specificity L-threonine aldolase [Bacteroidales bacterium]